MMSTEELWRFDDWMTFNSEIIPLEGEIVMPIQWPGLLPYPPGEDYRGQEEPLPCSEYLPQDFNRDCCVDMKDFAFFASAWLDCTLPEIIRIGD